MSSTAPRRSVGFIVAALAISCCLLAQQRPAAVVVSGDGGTYRRAKDEFDLALHPGEVLFPGDQINTGDAAETALLMCPAGRVVSIPAHSAAGVGTNQIRPRGRVRVSSKPIPPCEFPPFDPLPRAAEYHLGASLFSAPALNSPAQAQTASAAPPQPGPPQNEAQLADLLSKLASAEKNKREREALAISTTLASYWPEGTEWKARIFRHGEAVAAASEPGPRTGHGTYAIVIGISQYKSPQASQLDYAHRDAQMIDAYLTNPRGGAIPADHIRLLVNEQATVSAIRDAFANVKRIGAETVVVFIASHGMEAGREAYIIANDTNPQDAIATAIPMSEINKDITSELAGVKTVFAWIDACHSGHVALNGLYAPPDGVLFGLAASKPYQQSYEAKDLGGGHGVFSWYLNDALNGGVAGGARNASTVYELIKYVESKVVTYTRVKQIPSDFGNVDQRSTLVSLNLRDPRAPLPAAGAGGALANARQLDTVDPLLALENSGQDVVLRYLDGDESPVSRADFAQAESNFASARKLAPESLWLEAREDFCAGRVAVFDKRYRDAIPLLEQAVRLDPADALAYNALGVAWLEQANYTRALAAFDDAIRRAPQWAYAWHNRALAYTQAGDYAAAIRAYRHSIEIAPRYFYLPYNLGVLYQTLNRRKDAEAAYQKAMELGPSRAEPHNALGTLLAAEGKRDAAEREFQRALELAPDFAVARQNLDALRAQPRKH
jgi:tetratricopeptide (TPR) repeat protein